MSHPYRILLAAMLLLISAESVWATHNRAGEIIVRRLFDDCSLTGEAGLTVEATIITYTKTSSVQADRDSLEICWGDGTCERISRSNGVGNPPQGVPLENDIKYNLYIARHTYPARGTYKLSMTDPNRNGGVLNVNFPFSDQIRFHLQTEYTLTNPQTIGCNNSPVLLQPPVDIGCVGRVFTHNPNAFDSDNDSLSYEFITPLQGLDDPVPNYQTVEMINAGLNNQITIDPETGDIVWDAPQRAGEYNIAILIREYRNGQQIGSIVRDMQILIEECENLPPVVEVPFDEICVIAGDVVQFDVRATAPITEPDQRVRLSALGGPFEVAVSPATFTPASDAFEEQPVVKTFRWETPCEAISAQFYQVVFKATDNFFGDTTGLATLKTVRIKVVGPPPEDVQAESESDMVRVSWELPYACEETQNNYFRGFTVWRREGNAAFEIDTCTPGLAGSGYARLFNAPRIEMEGDRYVHYDDDVERGRTYCYRILAHFALTTPTGTSSYNPVESLASDSVCIQLSRDIPLITNVSVLATDGANGEMEVCWSKPLAADLDTLQNPGPYIYELLRAPGLSPSPGEFALVERFSSPDFAGANDTCFVDTGLNTAGQAYSYRVAFYVDNRQEPLGLTNPASSVFLGITPTDRTNILSWQENVPWSNFEYQIFREESNGDFELLATVAESPYRDEGLENGEEYCYFVRSLGTYGVEGIASPLFNDSQRDCGVPVDDVPPCATTLEVFNSCDENTVCDDERNLFNRLQWLNPNDICEDTDDTYRYNIYYAPFEGSDFTLIASVEGAERASFEDKPEIGIAGCYAVTAIDTVGNESAFSNIVCVDNCPSYLLPNAFTPNGDGQNDVFRPMAYCFIDRVEFSVFNRWGQVVFTTTDPDLNWDGRNLRGEALAEGTYYYTCRYFEQRVTGVVPAPELLSGYIELVRGGNR